MEMTESEKHLNKKLDLIFDLVEASLTNDTDDIGKAMISYGILKIAEKP